MSNERIDSRDIISDYIFYSKYSRVKPDGKKETWPESVSRVMEMHYEFFNGKIKDENKDAFNKAFQEAWSAYYNQEVLGSQRSLQYGGPQLLKNNFRSFNCSGSYCNRIEFFQELMELLLSGSGVGYSIQKVHIKQLPIVKGIDNSKKVSTVIEDSIEGWALSTGLLIESYYKGLSDIEFDYSHIRPEGAFVSGGFKAPGPEPLKVCHDKLRKILSKAKGRKLRPFELHLMSCIIADAVISGGIRRSAMISIFDIDDEEMLQCKTGDWFLAHPELCRCNNSVAIYEDTPKEKYDKIFEYIKQYGEPGLLFMPDTEMVVNPCCFAGDTLIAVADGRNAVSIKELSEIGKEFPVYYKTDKNSVKITNAKAFWTGKKELIEIVLSNGSSFRCTKDHFLRLKDGDYVLAEQSLNKTLSKFYSVKSVKYRTINNLSNGYARQYRMLWEFYNGPKPKGFEIDHIEDDKGDFIDNLELLTKEKHLEKTSERRKGKGNPKNIYSYSQEELDRMTHNCSIKSTLSGNGRYKGLSNLELIEVGRKTLELYGKISYKLCNKVDERFPLGFSKNRFNKDFSLFKKYVKGELEYQEIKDERVIIEKSKKDYSSYCEDVYVSEIKRLNITEDVYDIEVEANEHNFAIITKGQDDYMFSEGIFVHNCEAALYPQYKNENGTVEYGFSFCNLCEINGKKVKTEEDFYKACRAAAILGTFQAAYTENLPLLSEATRKIMKRDALLGVGITGMADNPNILFNERIQRKGAKIIKEVNKEVAAIIGINTAARTTVIKPSGNASQLLGCVPADTPILTENGIKRFDEVKVGEKVWSYNKEKEIKELKSVIATHDVIVKSEDQIKISGLFGSIITSKKHPLLVFREGKWEYLPAGMLKIGDVIQKGIFQSKEISFNKKAYLVGLFLGDGCAYYNKKGDQLIIEILGDNKEVVDKFTEIMNEYSCCNFKTKECCSEKYSVPVWYNRFHLGLNNPLVKDWFNLVEIEVGKKSDKIRIPSWIKKSYDKSIVFSFLAGIIDSDGWINPENGLIHYGTASKLMKDDLLEYLPLFGIYPWAHVSETKTYTYEGFKPNFDFNTINFSLLGNDLKLFASFLSHSKKREGLLSKKETLIKRKLVIPRELIKNEADYIFSEVKSSSKRWAFIDSVNKGVYVRANYYTKQNKDFSHIVHYDRIISIEDDLGLDENFKDVTVEDNHSYIVGYGSQYVSHNCGSGIHAYHFRKYIRNIQANNNEQALKEVIKLNPDIANPSFWNKKGETVLSFPIELDDETMVRTDFSTLDFLYRIYTTEKGWIIEGTNTEHPSSIAKPKYHHNVSCTVSVKEDEWSEIADWIWEHKDGFCGLSFLPETGDLDYPQAPYTSYLDEKELADTYGQGAILSSGLIVDGLQVFGDIWTACNAATGKANDLLIYTDDYLLSFIKKHIKDGKLLVTIDGLCISDVNAISSYLQHKIEMRNDWVRRFKKFSKNYFEGDDEKCSRCLKHVNIFHQWQKIKNQKPIDWENVEWEQEYKNVGENVATACAGGACELR